ncbi:hypothetical protein [Streptomyces sp. NRRL F-2664]|uniref:hypothetical protein n=1 Tax=Streptomyces sp. NRRL F-2664 TaxID=1463842 RepID=UPI0004C5F36E|nr:hypothetical protein [Streptomyces sp. NRRL F-2664]
MGAATDPRPGSGLVFVPTGLGRPHLPVLHRTPVNVHGITTPEVPRHPAVPKRPGLMHTRRQGRYARHPLDPGAVARIGSDFVEGILR